MCICIAPDKALFQPKRNLVHLSLLTITNPNQLCDVLLFVCSKMADETNLSSKLPVADSQNVLIFFLFLHKNIEQILAF